MYNRDKKTQANKKKVPLRMQQVGSFKVDADPVQNPVGKGEKRGDTPHAPQRVHGCQNEDDDHAGEDEGHTEEDGSDKRNPDPHLPVLLYLIMFLLN